jgi:hypothetical protein
MGLSVCRGWHAVCAPELSSAFELDVYGLAVACLDWWLTSCLKDAWARYTHASTLLLDRRFRQLDALLRFLMSTPPLYCIGDYLPHF